MAHERSEKYGPWIRCQNKATVLAHYTIYEAEYCEGHMSHFEAVMDKGTILRAGVL